jgi:hypothetical protein
MRALLIALSASLVLASCGGGDEATPIQEPVLETPQFINWGSLTDEQVIVAEGVNYTVSDGAARILGVPQNAGAGGSTGGVGVRLPDDFERDASGNQVRITVRASSADPGALLGVAYSTADVGNSGWQAFNLTPEPADFTFDYIVPAMQVGNGDFLGFRSYGDDTVTVYGYQVELIGSAAVPSDTTTP